MSPFQDAQRVVNAPVSVMKGPADAYPFPTLAAPVRFAIAAGLVGLVFLLDRTFDLLIDDGSQLILFGIAVLATAWFAGTGPAIAATILAAALGTRATHSSDFATGMHLALFLVQGLVLTAIVAELRRARRVAEERAEEARQAQQVGESANRLKDEFLATVSHELRTPLTTIKTLARLLLRQDPPEEKRREYLETISVECDRQIDLVLNLLDTSRIEGGVFRLVMEKVDVGEVIRSCVKSETSAAERRAHKLVVQSIDHVPPVYADPKALRRVLSNLIENAIKYTPDGGSIQVFARSDHDLVSIGVKDNGRGIPAEDLPVLFDKFHRGRPAPHSAAMRNATEDSEFLEDADVSGVGLGLYLAKNVMERMGGDITVDTEVGIGSTFTLHLPIWKSEDRRNLSSGEDKNGEAASGC